MGTSTVVGRISVALTLAWGSACGSQIELLETSDGSTGASDSTTGSTAGPPVTTVTPTTTTSDDTTAGTSDSVGTTDGLDEAGSSESGCSFTCPPPPPPPPEGNTCNCPEGEKCMPWANDGGEIWNAIRCSPIAEIPGQPGDPCVVEGYQWSGVDDCDYGALCFGVDPKTNEGVCVSFCSWFGDGPCDDGSVCEAQPGELGIPLCVPACDPTAPDCDPTEGCFPSGSAFTCQPAAKMRAPVGAPCPEATACVAGALCAYGLDCAQAEGEGCCVQVCDLDLPNPCAGPSMCQSWFGGAGGPEWSHVGYCTL